MSLPLRPLSLDVNTKQLDSKQKKYHQAVEKALHLFDSVTEWADYISSLGKLLKALQSWAPKFQNVKYYVPYPYQVARRLSSSLSPNLPSGVHLKALEVYSYIFEKIGPETLGKEVNIWIGGILPLMSYASISVKHPLIDLYEKYIVSLPSATLKIIVKPLLASLFPGIDDESSESQASVMNLIETLYANLDDASLFWQSCFIIIINNKDRRLGAVVWLTKKLPSLNAVPHLAAKGKQDGTETGSGSGPAPSGGNTDTDAADVDAGLDSKSEQERKQYALSLLLDESKPVVTPEPGLLIRSFVKCLDDDNEILIQRGILDLLLQRLHLHSPLLQLLAKPSDTKLLIMSACKTMLKKDMSLNRRTWNWLLGPALDPESGDHNDSNYFLKNGSQHLLDGLAEMIEDPNTCIDAFKIVSALMDRWQIGSHLTPKIFIPLIDKCKTFSGNQAVLKTASSFFDSVETDIIWGKMFNKVFLNKDYDLLLYVLQNFNCATDEEITVRHLPLILLSALSQDVTSIPNYMEILEVLVGMIPERAYLPIQHSSLSQTSDISYEDTFSRIQKYYETVSDPLNVKTVEDSPESKNPFNAADITFLISYRVHALLIDSIRTCENVNEFSKLFVLFFEVIPDQLELSSQDTDEKHHTNWSDTPLIDAIFEQKGTIEKAPENSLEGIVEIYTKYLLRSLPVLESMKMLKMIIQGLWSLLLDHNKQIDAIAMFRVVTRHVPSARIESCLSFVYLEEKDINNRLVVLNCLWTHLPDQLDVIRRPLSLTLDELSDEKNTNYWFVYEWLTAINEGKSGSNLFQILVQDITQFEFIAKGSIDTMDDLSLFTYHIDVLRNTLKNQDTKIYKTFETLLVPQELSAQWVNESTTSYKNLVIAVLLKFLMIENEAPGNSIKSVLSLLSLLVNGTESNFKDIVTNLLQISTQYISNKVPDSEVVVVSLLHIISQVLSLSEKRKIRLDIFTEDSSHLKYIDFLVTTVSHIEDDLVFSSYATLLSESISYFEDSILKIILPLSTSIVESITRLFAVSEDRGKNLKSITALMRCLEEILEVSHGYLQADENSGYFSHGSAKNDFLQNMVSNVFSSDTSSAEARVMNERMVVLKSFTTVASAMSDIWNWADQNSLPEHRSSVKEDSFIQSVHEISVRYKAISKSLIERLFVLEPSDILESLITKGDYSQLRRLNLSLDNGRYTVTISRLLQGIVIRCNETNSASLFASHKGRKNLVAIDGSQLSSQKILSYLLEYVNSLENSAVEDFYSDFVVFLKEVLGNFANYCSIGFSLLKLVAMVSEKLDYSSLGQERRVRKDISDSFVKLLNSVLSSDPSEIEDAEEILPSLYYIVERLSYAVNELSQGDRYNSVLNSIVVYAILPYSKKPSEISDDLLNFMKLVAQSAERVKSWKQFLNDIFSDSKTLTALLEAESEAWNYVFYQWSQYPDNKENLLADIILSVAPKSNVITPSINPFNNWSDSEVRSKYNNILRAAYLVLISPKDHYYLHCQSLLGLVERLIFGDEKTLQSSGYTLFRALLLKFSHTHFVDHWSMLFSGLQSSLLTIYESIQVQQAVDASFALQVSKTLDLLLAINVEEFSATNEWIFIIDTINSIYKKDPYVALADEISQCKELAMVTTAGVSLYSSPTSRAPLLAKTYSIDAFTQLVPFFFNISYNHYEDMYNLKPLDLQLCIDDVLGDIYHQLG